MIIAIKENLMRAGYTEDWASHLALEIDEASKNEAEDKETTYDMDMLVLYKKVMDTLNFDYEEPDE